MVMPGVTTKNASEKRLSEGLMDLLSASQAMSIAIRVVLPVPVAILSATRHDSRIGIVTERLQLVEEVATLPVSRSYFGKPDGGFGSLHLTEVQVACCALGLSNNQAGSGWSQSCLADEQPPLVEFLSDVVDEAGLLDAVLCPLCELHLLLRPARRRLAGIGMK